MFVTPTREHVTHQQSLDLTLVCGAGSILSNCETQKICCNDIWEVSICCHRLSTVNVALLSLTVQFVSNTSRLVGWKLICYEC